MSEVIDIKQLAQLSVEKMKTKELRQYTEAQQNLIASLQRDNHILQEKVKHLENLLLSKAEPKAIPLTDEEIVCMEQIELIRNKSKSRELSLDEVKRLDLLIKNLRLIRQQSTQVIDSVDYSNLKEADLVAIATSSENITDD